MTDERGKIIKKYWNIAKEKCPFHDEDMQNPYYEGFLDGATEATKELQEENERLKSKEYFVGDVNRQNMELQQKIEVLQAEIAEFKKENKNLKGQIVAGEVFEDEMSKRIKELEVENEALKSANRSMVKELDDKYEEYKDYFSKEEVYSIVSKRILSQGENARTIKNKIQAVLEELLFKTMLESKEDESFALEEN